MRSVVCVIPLVCVGWLPLSSDKIVFADESGVPRHRVSMSRRATFRATLHVEVNTDSLTAKEWFLFAPQPPELAGQTNVNAKLSPSGKSVKELSPKRRGLLAARVKSTPNNARHIDVEAEYQVTLWNRQLVERSESDPFENLTLSPAERSQWLAKSPMCTFQERDFQTWLDDGELRLRADEDVIDFARRVFHSIRADFEYEYLPELDRRAIHVCREKKSDCMGLSVLFVSVMRANQIPARILVGRWAQSSVAGDKLGGVSYSKEHVKCEFFAEDVGWVPTDLASALLHDRTPSSTRFFGQDPANFVTLHVDDHLVVEPGPIGRRTIPFLQDIRVWVIGQGKDGNLSMRQNWTVERIGN